MHKEIQVGKYRVQILLSFEMEIDMLSLTILINLDIDIGFFTDIKFIIYILYRHGHSK